MFQLHQRWIVIFSLCILGIVASFGIAVTLPVSQTYVSGSTMYTAFFVDQSSTAVRYAIGTNIAIPDPSATAGPTCTATTAINPSDPLAGNENLQPDRIVVSISNAYPGYFCDIPYRVGVPKANENISGFPNSYTFGTVYVGRFTATTPSVPAPFQANWFSVPSTTGCYASSGGTIQLTPVNGNIVATNIGCRLRISVPSSSTAQNAGGSLTTFVINVTTNANGT